MTDETILNTQEVKANQHRNLLILSGFLVVFVCGLYYLMGSGSSDSRNKQEVEAPSFSRPLEQMNTQSLWMDRAQNKLKELERQTAELKNEMTKIKSDDSQKSVENNSRYQELEKQNHLLQEALQTKGETQGQAIQGVEAYKGQVFSTTPGATMNTAQRVQQDGAMTEVTGIDNNELHLKPSNFAPKKNPDSFVPAGTFAEAIMLGAADASAGVQAQSNPSPMLFRLVADGTLPNHKKSHLKDCVVTAAVVGDISSERGQIRLERMSCTFPNGEIVEQPVDGTVFGMDAKNGVRGKPVWREGALLGRAAVAGTLSGLGSAVSQSYTTNSISPLGTTQTVNSGEIFKYGAAQGASNAMEKLAEYNIRRAEQYHPVIQLSAGQPVDVVFLCGFYLDGRKHEPCKGDRNEASSNENRQEPNQLFPSVQTPSGLTLSERELEKIKQNEKAMGWVQKDQSGGMQ